MKAIYLGAAILAAGVLAGCGGKASFEVKGNIAGLANPGLVLRNGNDTVSVPVGATTYAFSQRIDYGTEYHVTVDKEPDHMDCTVLNGDGAAGRTTEITVNVSCVQNEYSVGGTVNNFKGDQIVLINGSTSGQFVIPKGATSFTFLPTIPVGQAYGLSILTQPKDPVQVCTIAEGSGVMGDYNRVNAIITCQ